MATEIDTKTDTEKSLTLPDAAALIGVTHKKLNKTLREINILNVENFPYKKYIITGHFKIIPHTYTNFSRSQIKTTKPALTEKGVEWVRELLDLNKQKALIQKQEKDKAYYQQKKAEKDAWKLLLTKPWRHA